MDIPALDFTGSLAKKALASLALLVFVFAGTAWGQTPITVGQTRTGNLSASSGRSVGCGNCFADTYQFSITSQQTLLISLNSEAFDAYLRVLNASGATLFEDDDGGGGSNSEIAQTFPPGTYRIEASTYNGGESGAYTLSLEAVTSGTPQPISIGQTVSGALTTSSGRSLGCGGCFADLYTFTLTSIRNLEFTLQSDEFDAFLRVLDPNGNTVASNDDGDESGTNSLIEGNFPPGTYFVETTTFNGGEIGAYTFSLLELSPPVVRPISVGQTVNGNLTSSSGRSVGCSGCYADLYEFSIASGDSLVIALNSAEFDAYLRVIDPAGNTLITDDDGGDDTNSRISYSFGAGTYRVEVTTFEGGEFGAYDLTVRVGGSAVVGTIQIGQTVSGTLSGASGRSVGCDGCYADVWRFTVGSQQTLVVTLNSADFDAYLRILDASRATMTSDDDSGGGTDSRIVRGLAPGTYFLEASTYDGGESGAYSLSLGATAAPVTRPISVGQTASGDLSSSSGRSVGCGGCFADLYQFTLASPQTLEVAMSSTALDAFVRVLDSNLETVTADDDSGGGTNARIANTFTAGTYFLEASTYDSGESGSYIIALLAVAAPPPLAPINVGGAASSNLTTLSGRSTSCIECFANLHEFTVSSPQTLVIALDSGAFDAFLRVLDSTGTVVASDDDSGGNGNSSILQTFAAGTYRIEVSSYYEGESGPYNLSIGPATAPTVSTISAGQTRNGNLTSGAGRSLGCGGCFADLYEFSVGSTQSLVVTMTSIAFDSYLRVLGANGVTVAFDDDSAGGTNARIAQSFSPGTYRIEATSYGTGESGGYTLSLQSFVTGALAEAPAITSLSPSSASAGGAGFTLTVGGRGFVSGSVVRWNGNNRSTTFVSATELRATISAGDLTAGTPSVSVFSPPPGGGVSNALRFTVVPTATLNITPQFLSFRATEDGGAPPNQTLSIANLGSGTLQWTATVSTGSGNWLRLSRASGSTPSLIEVSANPAGLKADVYTGRVIVRAGSAAPVTVVVTLLVSPAAPILRISQAGFTFQGVDGRNLPEQSFEILNAGQGTLNWQARVTTQDGRDWFSVEPASGSAEGGPNGRNSTATIRVDPTRLRQGTYTGLLTLEAPGAPNSPLQIYVHANILEPGSDPVGDVRPAGLIFIGTAGSAAPAPQDIFLSSTGGKSLSYSVQAITEGNWLTVTPSAGELDAAGGSIPIRVRTASGLAANVYRGRLRITFSTGNATEVAVSYLVRPAGTTTASYETAAEGANPSITNPAPRVDCLPTDLVMEETLYGGNNLAPQVSWGRTLQVRVVDYPCGQPVTGAVVKASFSNGDPLLILDPVSDGIYTKLWSPSNPEGTVLVTLQARASGLQSTLALEGKVLAAGGGGGASARSPQIFPRGIVNGASFAAGQPLSPGSIFSLFGRELSSSPTGVAATSLPLPRDLGETRITIAGLRVPLFFSADGQVNGQVPFELSSGTTTQVVATTLASLAAPEQITMAEVQPGIFTVNSSGQGQGAILIANIGDTLAAPAGSIPGRATRPARAGEFLTIYCTGLGSVTDPPPSGTPAQGDPLSHTRAVPAVTIGGVPATVSFSGLAPGFVGLYQVNVEVPANAPRGDAVPLVLTIGGVTANTVTVAVGN